MSDGLLACPQCASYQVIDITTMDDALPVLMCGICGHQGTDFWQPADEPEAEQAPSLLTRVLSKIRA